MIAVRVMVDGELVASALARSRWELPDVVAGTTRSYDHNPDLSLEREEKVRDASGELSGLVIHYRTRKAEAKAVA